MKKLMQCIKIFYSLMIAGIISICLLFQSVSYARTKEFFINNIWIIPIGLLVIFGIFLLLKLLINNRYGKFEVTILFSINILFLVLQIYCVYNYYFYTDWDAKTVVDCAYGVVNNNFENTYVEYFSMCPNNLLIVFIFSKIIQISRMIGCEEYSYFFIVVFQCFISSSVAIMTFYVIKKITKMSLLAWMGWVLYILILGISPWVSIPYSDSTGLFFPVFILFLYTYVPNKNWKYILLKGFISGFILIIAYKIKPQTFIVFIAIAGIELINLQKLFIKKYVFLSLAVSVGIIAGIIGSKYAINSLGIEVDKEKSFGITHYLMLGSNPEAMGVWAESDVIISQNCATAKERRTVNLEVFSERISSMGLEGIAKQAVRKTLTNFNDGTFCWGGEGTFYYEILPEKSSPLSGILRKLYYNRGISPAYIYYEMYAQIMWMGTLFFSIFMGIRKRNKYECVIMLTIIGLTLFETIFEARARYLFIYVPFFIITAVLGLHSFHNMLKKINFDRCKYR